MCNSIYTGGIRCSIGSSGFGSHCGASSTGKFIAQFLTLNNPHDTHFKIFNTGCKCCSSGSSSSGGNRIRRKWRSKRLWLREVKFTQLAIKKNDDINVTSSFKNQMIHVVRCENSNKPWYQDCKCFTLGFGGSQ